MARGDEASYGVIIDLVKEIESQLARLLLSQHFEHTVAFQKMSARVITQLLVILGVSTRTLKEHRLRLRMTSEFKLQQSLYAVDLRVREAVDELRRLAIVPILSRSKIGADDISFLTHGTDAANISF